MKGRTRYGSAGGALTVQRYLAQSSQKRLAENFFLMTTVRPWSRHCPTPMMFPAKHGVGVTASKRCPRPSENQERRYALNISFLIFWAAEAETLSFLSQGFVKDFLRQRQLTASL